MRTRPEGLPDREIAGAVTDGWGLDVQAIEYAPVGFGSYHWRIIADDRRWFVTADDLVLQRRHRGEPVDEPRRRLTAALSTACSLRDAGLDFVVAPLPTTSGAVLQPAGERFAVALYPFVEGEPHPWGPYPSPAARHAVIDRLAVLHAVPAQVCPTALVDDLVVPDRDRLEEALDDLAGPWDAGPFGEAARTRLAAHAGPVTRLLAHYDGLAAAVAGRTDRLVVTHGEPHRGNTIDTADGVVLIDWDTALVAAPERDLWLLHDQDASVLDEYSDRTGVRVDGDAIDVHRFWWDLAEIANGVGWFRAPHREDEDTLIASDAFTHYLDSSRWPVVA